MRRVFVFILPLISSVYKEKAGRAALKPPSPWLKLGTYRVACPMLRA
jgi:hypothetical protein